MTAPASSPAALPIRSSSGARRRSTPQAGPSTATGGIPTPGRGPGWVLAGPGIAAAASALPVNPERLPGAGETAAVGLGDRYFPTILYDAVSLSYGQQQAGNLIWPTMQDALSLAHLDGLLQYHAIYRQLDAVKHQYGCFLESFLPPASPRWWRPARRTRAAGPEIHDKVARWPT